MSFFDRVDAGKKLGAALRDRVSGKVVVAAIPRGGVVVGVEVAAALGAALEVFAPRKVRAPGNPELGLGAVAPDGVALLDPGLVSRLRVDQQYLDREVDEEAVEARRRMELYRGSSDPPNVAGATVVIVDDGIATGGTARAAAAYAKRLGAVRVILAVPVAPQDLEERLGEEVDEIVVLEQPFMFMAVGQFYADFHQVSDDEVLALLAEARAGQEGKGG